MTPAAALRLGRASNLPTVWSNILAGFALAGTAPEPLVAGTVVTALSLLYVAGMFLNDAFDRDIDAIQRPGRPIPAGQASAAAVFAAGFGMMAAGVALPGGLAAMGRVPWTMPAATVALAAAILLYNIDHKDNPWAPAVMGLCRALVYIVAATALAPPGGALLPAAAALFCHVAGLTHAARHEATGHVGAPWPLAPLAVPALFALGLALTRPAALLPAIAFVAWTGQALVVLRRGGDSVPRAVAMLVAGMALFDAAVATAFGGLALGGAAAAAFLLTVALQRHIPGP